jgi:hypothetical protein
LITIGAAMAVEVNASTTAAAIKNRTLFFISISFDVGG